MAFQRLLCLLFVVAVLGKTVHGQAGFNYNNLDDDDVDEDDYNDVDDEEDDEDYSDEDYSDTDDDEDDDDDDEEDEQENNAVLSKNKNRFQMHAYKNNNKNTKNKKNGSGREHRQPPLNKTKMHGPPIGYQRQFGPIASAVQGVNNKLKEIEKEGNLMDYVNFVLSEDGIRNVINGEQMEEYYSKADGMFEKMLDYVKKCPDLMKISKMNKLLAIGKLAGAFNDGSKASTGMQQQEVCTCI